MGTGLGQVPQTQPVPVSAQPIPGYPCGFTNPCYALYTKIIIYKNEEGITLLATSKEHENGDEGYASIAVLKLTQ